MFPQSDFQKIKTFNQIDQNAHKDSNANVGKWTNEENLKYAIFMDFHRVTLSSKQKKKNFKVFQQMSMFIGSRNTVQCRSHHQKLQERFKHFKKIISAVKNQIGRKQYKIQFNKWTNSGQKLIFVEPQIQENHGMDNDKAQKEFKTQEIVEKRIEGKNEEITFNPTVFPFFTYSPFHNSFTYSLPSIYPFTAQYYR